MFGKIGRHFCITAVCTALLSACAVREQVQYKRLYDEQIESLFAVPDTPKWYAVGKYFDYEIEPCTYSPARTRYSFDEKIEQECRKLLAALPNGGLKTVWAQVGSLQVKEGDGAGTDGIYHFYVALPKGETLESWQRKHDAELRVLSDGDKKYLHEQGLDEQTVRRLYRAVLHFSGRVVRLPDREAALKVGRLPEPMKVRELIYREYRDRRTLKPLGKAAAVAAVLPLAAVATVAAVPVFAAAFWPEITKKSKH